MRDRPFAADTLGQCGVILGVDNFEQPPPFVALERLRQSLHQAKRNRVEIAVALGQIHQQFVVGFHFIGAGDFLPREVAAVVKNIADKAVELLTVIKLEVVSAGVVIDVRAQKLTAAKQVKNRLRGIEQRRLRVAGGEAAFVLCIVCKQRGAIGQHRGEVRVVRV